MADLVITAANVIPGANAHLVHGTAGATITAGKTVYLDPVTKRYKLADCDDASEDVRDVIGIALHAASDGQPLALIKRGDLALGVILTAGVAYYLSPVAGGICPVADLASGDYPTLLGLAKSTSVLSVNIQKSGTPLAA